MNEIISEWLDSQAGADRPREYLSARGDMGSLWRPYDDALVALRNGDKAAARQLAASAMWERLRWETLGNLVADAYHAAEMQAVRRLHAQAKVAA